MADGNNYKKQFFKKLQDIINSDEFKKKKFSARVPVNSPRRSFALRAKIVVVAVVLAFSACIGQLVNLQIVHSQEYKTKAEQNQLYDKLTPAQRGSILDVNGVPLAQSASVWRVYVDPSEVPNDKVRNELGEDLAKALKLEKEDVMAALNKKEGKYYVIKTDVEYEEKEKVLEILKKDYKYIPEKKDETKKEKSFLKKILDLFKKKDESEDDKPHEISVKGRAMANIEEDSKRYYPNKSLAANVLGYTNNDGRGGAGLELYYNSELMGTPGRKVTAKNAVGDLMPNQYKTVYEAKQGSNLVLTIDSNIQAFLENALDQAFIDNKCASANGIVMDVNTGAVLAMATRESFDPNNPWDVDKKEVEKRFKELLAKENERNKKKNIVLSDKQQRELEEKLKSQAFSDVMQQGIKNRTITDTYEPGSVFKTITACAAIEEGVATPDTKVECKPGGITIDGRTYHCANHNVHGVLDMTGGLTKSCNSYFITMGQKLGTEAFAKYFEAFGFTEKTGIDLPGEAQPVEGVTYHKLDQLSRVNLASCSFGQSFQVTPIQMITALSAIANGGKLMQPYVVAKTTDENGRPIDITKPVVRRQVISEKTSKTVADMMQKVVNEGTAKIGYVSGYRVGGKTGTSQKLSKKGEYIASYGCFAPADDAKIAVLITIDEPHGGQIHGGQIAAPVAARVVESTLKYMNVEPRYTDEELKNLDMVLPKYTGEDAQSVKKTLTEKGFNCKIIGNGKNVVRQLPAPYQPITKGGVVVLYTENNPTNIQTKVPDFTGLSLIEATQRAAAFGINIKISGNTLVDSELIAYGQDIKPQTTVDYGKTVKVYFRSNKDDSELID